MNVALYIVFALIVVLSIWSGYKHGLILSVAHLAAIVASLYLAALLSGAFSNEIVSGMRPFAEGYLDHQVATEVMPKLNLGGDNLSVADALEAKPDTAYSFCYETYRAAGIAEKPAKQMAREAQTYAAAQHTTVSDGLVHIFCEKLAFVAGTALAFILILVLLLAVGNLPNLTFRLPEHERLDDVGGALVGLANGVAYCILLCWVLQFAGILIGRDTLEHNIVANILLKINILTIGVGI
jgi:hypothetical protein